MKRWMLRTGLLLLMGALASYAVAWGLVVCTPSPIYFSGGPLPPPIETVCGVGSVKVDVQSLVQSTPDEWGTWNANAIGEYRFPTWVNTPVWFDERRIAHLPAEETIVIRTAWIAQGWPLRSMKGVRASWAIRFLEPDGGFGDAGQSGVIERSEWDEPLVWWPIWPGFLINTLFYAAILWLVFIGPGRVRRWRRCKRGLCPACAYPVGGGEVCSECGAARPRGAAM